ncbi:uncharacterized protein LOC109858748 [Pseudomyrmex gracilis]|uniref:uncharacterized protein LOC109858748 n=1 Tax=Pseudomyrmex gracilis TaxID=219809 RepID=UPI0009950485|nr:uncharacterized protein LOC109858748 [Pseudomyrmex gracilis]XP_020291893.1 uncharacterized protein LOC109858748 [Pseudomyrmex gracilis]XP_020291894.1 uncharacterized protein LOC109858748 [Pseudomyrmex gracilis]XP_020291895.1 uncharacterized protein LOC109858748 [Pseudomyrmex gracilis]
MMSNMERIKLFGQPPKVWEVLEKIGKDGKRKKFTIQEIPEDRYEEAVQHMCTYYLADEPLCACFNLKNTPLCVQIMSAVWRQSLSLGISVAAFTDNPDGGKPILAGMNVLIIQHKQKKDATPKKCSMDNCQFRFSDLTDIVCDRYGIDKYLYAYGLIVTPEFRGYGLGTDILKIRNHVGREYNIPATSTVFTSIISQNSAANAGFEVFLEKKFSDIVDENGKKRFPGVNPDIFKVMGKRLL